MLTRGREESLLSALGRLPSAVAIVDENETLAPYNGAARRLFERESLRPDLVRAAPSHALSLLVRRILDDDPAALETSVVTFPSGRHYKVEPSRKSPKGSGRWLLLLVEEVRADVAVLTAAAFQRWGLTDREAEIAGLIVQGLPTADICDRLDITPATLKTHVRHLLGKSDTRNRTELLAAILRTD